MKKMIASINDLIDGHIVPLLLSKLGGGWRKRVRLGADSKANRVFINFINLPRKTYNEIRAALFNLAHGINVHGSADSHNMKFSMTLQPA